MPPAPIEPSSMHRQFAKHLRQTFIALTQEGFEERQALAIIGQMLAASAGGQEE